MKIKSIKFFFVGIFIGIALPSIGQEMEAPDYQEIRRITTNSKSQNYYPSLLNRFVKNDTTLTLEQYRFLYYGFTLQEDFVPYQSESEELMVCRREIANKCNDKNVLRRSIKVADKALDNNPFDLLAITTQAIAHLQLGDTLNYELWNQRQKGILDAILSSGDGDAPNTAFYVINIEHEYEVINRLGLTVEKDSLCSSKVEYLKVKDNPDREDGFFFNFEPCREVYNTKYPDVK